MVRSDNDLIALEPSTASMPLENEMATDVSTLDFLGLSIAADIHNPGALVIFPTLPIAISTAPIKFDGQLSGTDARQPIATAGEQS